MFQNKNASLDSSQVSNSSGEKMENIPVHTMQKDLKEINNPNFKKNPEISENIAFTPMKPKESQKPSPFSAPPVEKKPANLPIAPRPQPSPAEPLFKIPEKKPATPINRMEQKNLTNKDEDLFKAEEKPKPHVGRIITATIIILVVLGAAGGGYYFWVTRPIETAAPVVPAPEPIPEPIPEPEPVPVIPQFSADKPNYLNIETDFSSAELNTIKDVLSDYVIKVSQANISTPVEFIVTDKLNNPVTFTTFANILGIKLSPAVMSNLAGTFSLFIYNDQGNTRLGLAVDSTNGAALKTAMLAEEKTLILKIAPLFLNQTETFANTAVPFGKSAYNTAEIHYVNLISTLPLSVDYTVFNNKLLIGTTKMTLRSIMDYLSTKNLSDTTEENGLIEP